MTKTYDVSIRVPASKLATIIETLDGEQRHRKATGAKQ